MLRAPMLGAFFPALLLLSALPPEAVDAGNVEAVAVTNFPSTQTVEGTVSIGSPVPSTKLLANHALVTPAGPNELSSWTEAGTLDASGFATATLSLAVTLQGSVTAPGKVGVTLVPDVPEVLGNLRNSNVVMFPITVEAPVTPSPSGIHQSAPLVVRLAFPRYRVYFYDATPRTAEVTLYSYLAST